jgi:hypothetical protein
MRTALRPLCPSFQTNNFSLRDKLAIGGALKSKMAALPPSCVQALVNVEADTLSTMSYFTTASFKLHIEAKVEPHVGRISSHTLRTGGSVAMMPR